MSMPKARATVTHQESGVIRPSRSFPAGKRMSLHRSEVPITMQATLLLAPAISLARKTPAGVSIITHSA